MIESNARDACCSGREIDLVERSCERRVTRAERVDIHSRGRYQSYVMARRALQACGLAISSAPSRCCITSILDPHGAPNDEQRLLFHVRFRAGPEITPPGRDPFTCEALAPPLSSSPVRHPTPWSPTSVVHLCWMTPTRATATSKSPGCPRRLPFRGQGASRDQCPIRPLRPASRAPSRLLAA